MDLFKMVFPEGAQIDFQIAVVTDPAIKSDWIKFNKEHSFKVQDAERRIVSGYAMIADLKIPRYNEATKEYYNAVFTKDSIWNIVYNFFRHGLTTNTNEMHQTNQFAEGVYVFESMVIDSARGVKAPDGFKQEPDGSWFISMKIENDSVWQKVVDETYRGFSIECKLIEEKMSAVDVFLSDLKVTIN